MKDYRTIAASDLGKGSRIALELCETEVDLYWKMAMEVAELIESNNQRGEPTVMIVPYGPLGPYARLLYLVNKRRISLKNCWFINMDEYLDEHQAYLPKDDPLSFRGGMDRIFYGLVDEELNVPEQQRLFPEPGNEQYIWELIQRFGKLDMCWGGVGITGHIAFNEPPESGESCTDAEFLERPTRILRIARETKTINAYMNAGADLDAIPDYCITVGMKEINFAQRSACSCLATGMPLSFERRCTVPSPVMCRCRCSRITQTPRSMRWRLQPPRPWCLKSACTINRSDLWIPCGSVTGGLCSHSACLRMAPS